MIPICPKMFWSDLLLICHETMPKTGKNCYQLLTISAYCRYLLILGGNYCLLEFNAKSAFSILMQWWLHRLWTAHVSLSHVMAQRQSTREGQGGESEMVTSKQWRELQPIKTVPDWFWSSSLALVLLVFGSAHIHMLKYSDCWGGTGIAGRELDEGFSLMFTIPFQTARTVASS